MFMGEYRHTVDPKGRLIVPSKFRELLGTEFVVTRGLDGCLFVYPMDSWTAYVDKLKKLPLTDKNARLFMRFLIAGANTCELDKQGRILLPATLREFAGLERMYCWQVCWIISRSGMKNAGKKMLILGTWIP